jgi:hypothetical protein
LKDALMAKSSMPAPRYTLWQAIDTALALGARAIEEVRTLARQPGPRGPDGLGFDDLEVVHDGVRGFTFKFQRGDQIREFPFKLPVMIYAGVFKEGKEYAVGDTVTWAGSLWHCDVPTEDKPGETSKHWTLIAKRGRDGKDGSPGRKGDPGPRGEPGQNLTTPVMRR